MSKNEPDARPPDLRKVITKLAKRLARQSAIGERAALRRLNSRTPASPDFWRIVVSDLDDPYFIADREPRRGVDERQWAVILAGLSEVAGAQLFRGGRRLGKAAAAAKVTEGRFVRLLRAHGDALLDLVRPLAHQLVSSGEAVDWTDVAELIRNDGRERDDEVRRHLAQDYFQTLHTMNSGR